MNFNYNYNFVESINNNLGGGQNPATKGLIVQLNYDNYTEGSPIWDDLSGFNNDARVIGDLQSTTLGWQFTSGSQLLLSASLNGISSIPTVNAYNYTLQAYITVDSGSGDQMLFNKVGDTVPGQGFFTSFLDSGSYPGIGNGFAYYGRFGGNTIAENLTDKTIITNPNTNPFVLHTLVTANAESGSTTSYVKTYSDYFKLFDSTLGGSPPAPYAPPFNSLENTDDLSFGGAVNEIYSYNGFRGTLKYLYIYNRPLTPNEIFNNYLYFSTH
jgi:hypothetical protein